MPLQMYKLLVRRVIGDRPKTATCLCLIFFPIALPLFILIFIVRIPKILRRRRIKELEGKVVLITGGSSGLGEALARQFYNAGCRVILASRRLDELNRVRSNIMKNSKLVPFQNVYPPVVLKLDLADLQNVPSFADEAWKIYHRIDILVNNAGISYRGEVMTTNLEIDLKLMIVNYIGHTALTKCLLSAMVEQGNGHIVVISSVQGKLGIPFRSAYSASKHALEGFFDTLRAEVADYNVKVTVVSPGYIRTNLSVNALTGDGRVYGLTDPTTANGMSPNYAASEILESVAAEDEEVVIAGFGAKTAILLRALWPSMYFKIMNSRARRGRPNLLNKAKEQ
ncbi:dehydrogenase/reductase SDR family protein 7-like isoform X2 [Artemia franciscana]